MNPSQPSTDFAAFVALDWADQQHAWALQAAGQAQVQFGQLENTPEAVEIFSEPISRKVGSWLSRSASLTSS